jgi:predicted ArsR family transcriptional regulator
MSYTIKDENLVVRDTKGKISEMLLESPKTSAEIADKLNIQRSAIRAHLEALQIEKIVTSQFKVNGLGRPKKIYMLTENGREMFTRRYDLILSLLIRRLTETEGQEHSRKTIENIADCLANDVSYEIEKDKDKGSPKSKNSLKILNAFSNRLGFMSSINEHDENNFSIISRNCILHKIASDHQDIICHSLHDRIIRESLNKSHPNVKVELKSCIALGNNICEHLVKYESKTSK